MKFEDLRSTHQRLRYRGYTLEQRPEHLQVRFDFLLEPDITFSPSLTLEYAGEIDAEKLEPFLFNLGMIELISYWKCACPPEIIVESGSLNDEQIDWWKNLFLHGLGEFFFLNAIDLNDPDLLQIKSTVAEACPRGPLEREAECEGALILTAGGKDSSVSLELLKDLPGKHTSLMLNPTRAALDSARIAGYTHPIVLRRTIDPKLIELNAKGYLNGHTPFSAYLAFACSFAAAVTGYRYVIASNELSSDEPNVIYKGVGINHQFSKSFAFEQQFRSYAATHLSSEIEYFSFLRPLFDLQIAKLFCAYPAHFTSFRSCNRGQRISRSSDSDIWCGSCAKCAFVYLSLAAFLDRKTLQLIFSEELLQKPQIQDYVRSLVGLGEHKPFECVGTERESREACRRIVARAEVESSFLASLLAECPEDLEPLALDAFATDHCLPSEFEQILRAALTHSSSTS